MSSSDRGPCRRRARERSGRNIAAGFLALLGAALIIVGSFVPWVDVDGGDAEQLVENTLISGWETSEGEVGDGVVFAVVGGMAAIIGLIILFNRANLVLKIVLILLGLVAAGLALIEAVDIADLARRSRTSAMPSRRLGRV